MKVYVKAMADSRKECWARLDNIGDPLIEHLIKLFYYSDNGNTEHWKDEVYSFLHSVFKLKNNKKFPSSKFIFDSLTDSYFPVFDKMESSVLYRYDKTLRRNVSYCDSSCKEFVSKYLRWISHELSECGRVSCIQVNDYLTMCLAKKL